jgi:hypothetical protein
VTTTAESPEQPQPASSQAITSLVLGILSFVTCCLLLSPIAWYLGRQELKAIHEGRSPAAGETLANVGRILGIVGTLCMAFVVFWIFFLGGLAVLSSFIHR